MRKNFVLELQVSNLLAREIMYILLQMCRGSLLKHKLTLEDCKTGILYVKNKDL